MDRWSLPGPAGFIAEVVDALRDGANVVVGVPLPVRAEMSSMLEDQLVNESWRVARTADTSELSPLDQLHETLEVDDDPSSRRSIASLMASIRSKHIVIVSGVETSQWPAWKLFLDDYANASRAVMTIDRTQLLMIAAGVPARQLPSKAPALTPLIWNGVVGEADVFGYAIQSWRDKGGIIDAKAKLVARIISRLALWDFDLIDRLLGVDPRDLFDPKAAVLAAAAGDSTMQHLDALWEKGGLAEFDGEEFQHALTLARDGDPKGELAMRLWAAQASELLPALEIKRRQLAQRMKDARLKLPVPLNGEMIHDLLDIEIGPLLRIAREHRLPSDIVRVAEKYWRLRNKLAHLRPLSASEALDPEVLTVRRQRG